MKKGKQNMKTMPKKRRQKAKHENKMPAKK